MTGTLTIFAWDCPQLGVPVHMEARFQFRLPRQPGREWGGKTLTLCYAEDTHVMSLSSATHLTEEDSTLRVEYKSLVDI